MERFYIYILIFLRKSTYIGWVHIEQQIQTAKKIIVEIQMIQAVEMWPRIKLSYFATWEEIGEPCKYVFYRWLMAQSYCGEKDEYSGDSGDILHLLWWSSVLPLGIYTKSDSRGNPNLIISLNSYK